MICGLRVLDYWVWGGLCGLFIDLTRGNVRLLLCAGVLNGQAPSFILTYRCRFGAVEAESEKAEATTVRLKSVVVFISDGNWHVF